MATFRFIGFTDEESTINSKTNFRNQNVLLTHIFDEMIKAWRRIERGDYLRIVGDKNLAFALNSPFIDGEDGLMMRVQFGLPEDFFTTKRDKYVNLGKEETMMLFEGSGFRCFMTDYIEVSPQWNGRENCLSYALRPSTSSSNISVALIDEEVSDVSVDFDNYLYYGDCSNDDCVHVNCDYDDCGYDDCGYDYGYDDYDTIDDIANGAWGDDAYDNLFD